MYAVLYSLEIDQRKRTAPAVFCDALPAQEAVASCRSAPLPTSGEPDTADESGGFGRAMGKPSHAISGRVAKSRVRGRGSRPWNSPEETLLNAPSGILGDLVRSEISMAIPAVHNDCLHQTVFECKFWQGEEAQERISTAYRGPINYYSKDYFCFDQKSFVSFVSAIVFGFVLSISSSSLAWDTDTNNTDPEHVKNGRNVIFNESWPEEYGPILTVKSDKFTFYVPDKFFYSNPYINKRSKIRTRLGFAFWYPDLRPTYRRRFFVPNPRPTEPDRPTPTMDESVVSAGGIMYVKNNSRKLPPESELEKVLKSPLNNGERYKKSDNLVYGLFEWKDRNQIRDYYFMNDDKRQRFIRCNVNKKVIIKYCSSILFIRKLNMKIGVSFILDQIPKWKGIEDATVLLLEKFMNNGPISR